MGKIILMKHAMPTVTATLPSNQWTLTEEGIKDSKVLAENLSQYQFSKIFSSNEPKAIQTARTIGEVLSKNVEVMEGLHEHERESKRVIHERDEWHELIKKFFEYPDELILGDETATSAKNRFSSSLHQLIDDQKDEEDIIVVTHGTVMSLFISTYNQVDIFELWNSFGLPSCAVLERENYRLIDVVNIH